jgi:hypothetical protein
LDSQADETPLVQDVRAWRATDSDGSGRVVVEGAWSSVAGGPPPVLLVDDGVRRHTLVALDEQPPDDPLAFRATFAVPAELAGHLDEGLALGLGRAEIPLALGEPAPEPWLDGPPVIAQRLTPAPVETGEPAAPPAGPPSVAEPVLGDDLPLPPSRRFDRGASAAGRGSIAAAILRATAPPPAEGATVVERSVIAERRAKRSEQLAAVMERRARGAEDTAQELSERIAALEARITEIAAERDRLAAELELQRAATVQAQLAREDAEARLAELVDPEGAQPEAEPEPAPRDIAAARRLPGLEEAARAMREQEPARPAATPEPQSGPDPFDDALAKLRSNGELAAAVAPRVTAEPAPEPPPGDEQPSPVIAAAAPRPPERVVPYLISADHPRTPWLARAIATLDAQDRDAAALLVTGLLPDQARTFGRPLAYDLDLAGRALRVHLGEDGSGRVLQRDEASGDAAFAVAASPTEFAPFAAGGAPWWPRGLRTAGARAPFARLARKRRRPVTLADLVDAGVQLDPQLAVRALACAVPAAWTAGHAFTVALQIPGREACRVLVGDGMPLRVLGAGEAQPRPGVVAATSLQRPESILVRGAADAVLGVTARGALPLLAQAEPPAGEEPAVVVGDAEAATTLLRWFDRVQGLTPRS